MNESPHRDEAREVTEAAREETRTKPSFASEVYLGRLDPDLVWPFPEQAPADREAGDRFLARLAAVLREEVDPDAVDREGDLPAAAIHGLQALGAFRMKLPEALGGLGFRQRNYNRAVALTASWCGSTAIWLAGHQSIGVGTPLALFGTQAQKDRYFPRLAAGALSAFALTEPAAGSDPAAMQMTAVPSEDGEAWILNGEKLWCTNGPKADLLIVMACTPDKVVDGRPRKQISAFLVESSWAGIETSHRCRFMGYQGIQNGLLTFRDVRVPKENLLWGTGLGLKLALITLNTGRLTLPATNTAVAKQCLAIVRRWGADRHQWGASIARHEAVGVMVAWVAAHTFAMEAMSDWAAALAERKDTDIRIEAAMAKLFCSEIGFQVVDRTLQVRGGRGYETESSLRARGDVPFPVERLFREARLNTIVEGSSQILRLFLAREALDPHFTRAGPLLDPKCSFLVRAATMARLGVYYAGWYVARWIPSFGRPADLPPSLSGHWAYVRRGTRKLARRIFYAMARWGPGLEHRQALLGRLVDEGTELTAMTVTMSRAASRGDAASLELADLFCRHARERIRNGQDHATTTDAAGGRVAEGVIEGRYRGVEGGILPFVPED